MWTRQQLKASGKFQFKRNYWQCVVVAFFMSLVERVATMSETGRRSHNSETYYDKKDSVVEAGASLQSMIGETNMILLLMIGILSIVFVIFLGNVLRVGGDLFFIQNRTDNANASVIFNVFKSGNYGNMVVVMFLKNLYIALWTLLFVIPGIVKSYEYMMVPYILAENPAMEAKAAFAISKKMMSGQKFKAFVLDLSFIGWDILGVLTFGLLSLFYVKPYKEATYAELYAYNKGQAYVEGYIR